jgi:membrane protein DedA with SNARE-associated domain
MMMTGRELLVWAVVWTALGYLFGKVTTLLRRRP